MTALTILLHRIGNPATVGIPTSTLELKQGQVRQAAEHASSRNARPARTGRTRCESMRVISMRGAGQSMRSRAFPRLCQSGEASVGGIARLEEHGRKNKRYTTADDPALTCVRVRDPPSFRDRLPSLRVVLIAKLQCKPTDKDESGEYEARQRMPEQGCCDKNRAAEGGLPANEAFWIHQLLQRVGGGDPNEAFCGRASVPRATSSTQVRSAPK